MLQEKLFNPINTTDGKIFGVFVLRLKLNIFYGGLVETVYQLGCGYKTSGFHVHFYALFATKKMRTIGMFSLIVKLVFTLDKVQALIK
jgi:hypothetical protein